MTPLPAKTTEAFGTVTSEQQVELQAIAIAAGAKAEIEAAYVVAMKRPRNEEDARVAINKVCRNPTFARKAKYCKPMGSQKVIGPSIRMAEEIGRHWGNILIQQTTIFEDDSKRIGRVTVKDLQSNIGYAKEYVLEKSVERKTAKGREILSERLNTYGERVFIVRATEDELLNKEAAIASKIIRNNILRMIPEHILEEALGIVDETLKSRASADPEAEKRKLLDQFGTLGIKASDVEGYLKHAFAQVTPHEIVELQDILNSIKDGQAKWHDYLERSEKVEKVEPARGDLSQWSGGKPGTHTHVEDPLTVAAQQSAQPDVLAREAEAISAMIQGRITALSKSAKGGQAVQEALSDFKVGRPESVHPEHQSMFLDRLDKARDELGIR